MNEPKRQDIKNELLAVRDAIIKNGDDPAMQLSGYILSEDPIYIPDIDGARSIVRGLDRDDILTELINEYFK